MTTEKIGQAAGAIWKRLHEKGTSGLFITEVKKIPGFGTDELLAGVGWLAREGKLCFKDAIGKRIVLSLVGEEICV
ncbi:MAG: winged helix-turn-helix domain-containing protein [Planctomycetes bacterium]|nr:winged helix-turn-helix domain-containing protein [Planctomycetota bacterium]